jgi:hypothetical protein
MRVCLRLLTVPPHGVPHARIRSVGLKEHSATAHTSHLLTAKDQFGTKVITVEIDAPEITRP